jgi:1,4-alpha-glucan branching enzyme
MKPVIKSIVVTLAIVSVLAARAVRAAEDEIATTLSYADLKATTVEVAGEFSNWKGLPLTKDADGNWTKTLYLKPGQYGYKFIVNGEWLFDPKNPARKTVNDVANSALTVGGAAAPASGPSATFALHEPTAKTVHVAGEFNRWLDNVDGKVTGKPEWLMTGDGAGNWKFTTQLPAGKYKFKYVIDGGTRWLQDPALPSSDDGNSIIEVKAGSSDTAAAPAPATAPAAGGVSFTFVEPNAKAVSVAGQFNNWNAKANPLIKDANGIWTATVPLKPGKYQYKFVIDGDWRLDPANSETQDDGGGNMNSVKTVAP